MATALTKQEKDFLTSFLCCCFETGGSGHWVFGLDCLQHHRFDAEGKRIAKCEIFEHHPDAVLRVYGLDAETGEDEGLWYELTAEKMLKGINKVIKYKSIEDDDAGMYDNGDADCALQLALLGAVVYG